jgi:hypothetical protein
LVGVLGVAACGSSGGSGVDSGGAAGSDGAASTDADDCSADSMITVSGALTGTRSAPAAASHWSVPNDNGVVLVDAQFGPSFLSGWSFTFNGKPTVGTSYTEATPGLSCVVTAADPATPTNVWIARKGVSGSPDQGTCSLSITSLSPTLVQADVTQYCAHGTVTATLPPKPGGTQSGDVTLMATF